MQLYPAALAVAHRFELAGVHIKSRVKNVINFELIAEFYKLIRVDPVRVGLESRFVASICKIKFLLLNYSVMMTSFFNEQKEIKSFSRNPFNHLCNTASAISPEVNRCIGALIIIIWDCLLVLHQQILTLLLPLHYIWKRSDDLFHQTRLKPSGKLHRITHSTQLIRLSQLVHLIHLTKLIRLIRLIQITKIIHLIQIINLIQLIHLIQIIRLIRLIRLPQLESE